MTTAAELAIVIMAAAQTVAVGVGAWLALRGRRFHLELDANGHDLDDNDPEVTP